MKRNKCISYYFLIKHTAEIFFSWLIYNHKLTTSKT
ncbi:dihydropteroate synthase, partial [Listeria monocytogenes]|nr:dihydropteroate synthase [Listeria monocytogenes]EAE9265276.1 dihydropteroate synthase [Listeria monocytogenes]